MENRIVVPGYITSPFKIGRLEPMSKIYFEKKNIVSVSVEEYPDGEITEVTITLINGVVIYVSMRDYPDIKNLINSIT